MKYVSAPEKYGGHCPSCGVQVAYGMPRCPKCHNKMPRSQDTTHGQRAPESGTPWLLIVIVAAVVCIGIALFMRSRGDDDDTADDRVGTELTDDRTGDDPDDSDVGSSSRSDTDEGGRGKPPEVEATRTNVLRGVARSLENRVLTGTVRVRKAAPDVVEIVSEQCADDRLSSLMDDKAEELSEQGFEVIVCLDGAGKERARRDL